MLQLLYMRDKGVTFLPKKKQPAYYLGHQVVTWETVNNDCFSLSQLLLKSCIQTIVSVFWMFIYRFPLLLNLSFFFSQWPVKNWISGLD